MQTIGPYRLLQALGTSELGGVWAAVDSANNPVTVAALSAGTAREPQSRNAFATAANGLAQTGQVRPLAGDFAGQIPWIAVAGTEGTAVGQVFVGMGATYHILPTESGSADQPAPPPAAEPRPAAATPPPSAGPPWARQVADDPVPASAPPPTTRRGRRVWLQAGIAGLLVVLVGIGAAVIASTLRSGDSPAGAGGPSAAPERPERVGGDLPTPTATPSQPGLEPPEFGEWPADWPAFGDTEQTTVLSDLAGVELEVELPASWECVPVTPEPEYAHYLCGRTTHGNFQIGGDLIVRECPPLCLEEQRVQMREQEEAWGLRWVRTSRYGAMAETTEIDGQEMYGLVVVAHWRSVDEDAIDRQLVLRMTAPIDEADEIRKVANALRRVARF